jgi:hypothetical protein
VRQRLDHIATAGATRVPDGGGARANVRGPTAAAVRSTKDPYVFDFLELAENAQERDLEQALIADIQKFLLELGTGFAFYGRQKALFVGDQEFFIDLLFYHHALRRFIVIELKIGKFQPEFVSKMNFYLNAVDEQLRLGDDRESVGIILCADRDETVAKRAAPRLRADSYEGSPTSKHPMRIFGEQRVPEQRQQGTRFAAITLSD